MAKYNLPHEEIKRFEVYNGRNTEQMPKLIADGRVPMNVSQIMERRWNLRNDKTGVKDFYMDNYFETGDAVVYHPETMETLIDLDSDILRGIHPNPKRLNEGAWLLSEDRDEAFAIYEQLKNQSNVVAFKKGKLGKINEQMSRKNVKAHPVWKTLARDQAQLDDYVDYIFAEGKQRFNYDTAMSVFSSSAQGNTPEMRVWYVYGLEARSGVDGEEYLDFDFGCLPGIAPEVPNALGKGASFDKIIKGLEGTLHPDVLKALAQLRKKL